jgi:hypothetical protein
VYRADRFSSAEQTERELILARCAVLGKKPDEYTIEDGVDDAVGKIFWSFSSAIDP